MLLLVAPYSLRPPLLTGTPPELELPAFGASSWSVSSMARCSENSRTSRWKHSCSMIDSPAQKRSTHMASHRAGCAKSGRSARVCSWPHASQPSADCRLSTHSTSSTFSSSTISGRAGQPPHILQRRFGQKPPASLRLEYSTR